MFPKQMQAQKSHPLQVPFTLRIFNPVATGHRRSFDASHLDNANADRDTACTLLVSASYRTRDDKVIVAKPDDVEYLKSQLNVDRLNEIHEWLKIVGRPMPPRPLHTQRMKARDILVTEQMDLHLVWAPKQMYIKPIPRFLLDAGFWEKHICHEFELYACALGFLRSYTALIQHESDYRIAIENHLLPDEVSWSQWALLVEQLLEHSDRTPVNKRFIYGELRLGRLNSIYRFGKGRFRGYLYTSTTYSDFLRGNLKSLLTLFAYATIVLSALQVGLGTHHLQDNNAFHTVSYVAVVFSMAAPLLAIALILIFLLGITLYNIVATMRYRKKRLRVAHTLHADQ